MQARVLEAFGESKPLTHWMTDSRCVVSVGTLYKRMAKGWSVEDALSIRPGDAVIFRPSFPAGSLSSNPNRSRYLGPKLTAKQTLLVLDHVDLARKLAAVMCAHAGDFDEVHSMANLGLIRAAMLSTTDDSFRSFAWSVMKRTVQEGWKERARWLVEVPSSDWLGATA